jgi:signal transduction histidine kinase
LERNALWLTQIVEDVLDVSRIVSGKIRLDVQPVELPVIIDNAVATVQPAADAKAYACRRSSTRASVRSLVIRAVCNKSSGIWFRTR